MRPSGWSKESRHKRGYGTAWDKLRLTILKRDNYLCQCPQCKAEDRVTPANEVDHIRPKAQGGTDDPENLRAINHDCHTRVSLQQRGVRIPQQIGRDGWPV